MNIILSSSEHKTDDIAILDLTGQTPGVVKQDLSRPSYIAGELGEYTRLGR